MSTSAYNVRSKPSDGAVPKSGPIKATIPMSSFLRPLNGGSSSDGNSPSTLSTNLFAALSPPLRHISPDHHSCGHRSPCTTNYYKNCEYIRVNLNALSVHDERVWLLSRVIERFAAPRFSALSMPLHPSHWAPVALFHFVICTLYISNFIRLSCFLAFFILQHIASASTILNAVRWQSILLPSQPISTLPSDFFKACVFSSYTYV